MFLGFEKVFSGVLLLFLAIFQKKTDNPDCTLHFFLETYAHIFLR
nr:MAG TPA: hypothetical protein [Caudoviricetes sp.]